MIRRRGKEAKEMEMDAFVIPRSPAGAVTWALGLPRAVNGTSAAIESASTSLDDPAPALRWCGGDMERSAGRLEVE